MLMIEKVGEILYRALSQKSRDLNLKDIYQRLANNEQQTAFCIREELARFNIESHSLTKGLFITITNLFFSFFTLGQLEWILKNILKRRMYSRWLNCDRDANHQFWQKLLEHEKIQFELLKLS
jgi:hypothetical protein